jgi:hypothetical protein
MKDGGAFERTSSGSWLLLLLCSSSFAACTLLDNLDELSSVPASAVDSSGAAGSGALDEPGSAGASAGASSAPGGAAGDAAGGAGAAGGSEAAAGSAGSSAGSGSSGSGNSGGSGGATRIFWLERASKSVHVANADGSQNQAIYTITGGQGSGLSGIAIDALASRIYFADEKKQRIQSAGLDGSNVTTPLSGLGGPAGIELDIGAGKLYFSERGATPRVQRANLDGTGVAPLITAVGSPCGLAVDAAVGKLYFVDDGLDAVFSSALDGSELTNLNISGVTDPVEISIDTLEGKLYWSERDTSGPRIRRANLDGSGVQDIITPLTLPGFSTAAGLEVDVAGRALYFIDGGTNGSILRANLDGTGTIPVINGLDDPTSLTLAGP